MRNWTIGLILVVILLSACDKENVKRTDLYIGHDEIQSFLETELLFTEQKSVTSKRVQPVAYYTSTDDGLFEYSLVDNNIALNGTTY